MSEQLKAALLKFMISHEYIENPSDEDVQLFYEEGLMEYGDDATLLKYALNDFCGFGEWI
jgi:hypothetical protein